LTTKSKLIQQQEHEQLQQQQQSNQHQENQTQQQQFNEILNPANFKVEMDYINFSNDQENKPSETNQLVHSNQHLVKLINDQNFLSASTTSSLPSSNASSVDSSPNLFV
jgi:hypothetical protein